MSAEVGCSESRSFAVARARAMGVRADLSRWRSPGICASKHHSSRQSASQHDRRWGSVCPGCGDCRLGAGNLPQGSHYHGSRAAICEACDLGTILLYPKPDVCGSYSRLLGGGRIAETDMASSRFAAHARLPQLGCNPARRSETERSVQQRIRNVPLTRAALDLERRPERACNDEAKRASNTATSSHSRLPVPPECSHLRLR